jgi:benzodiazapine receptor
MVAMVKTSDRTRAILVAVMAVAQVLSGPVTALAMGPDAGQKPISDANLSTVTPAGWAFAIWALIYAGSLVLAVYQLLPSQLPRQLHRTTGWWLVGAFTASTVWVPIFGSGVIWLSQVTIIMLVVCLIFVARRFTRIGPAANAAERYAFRLPVMLYLGWATLACAAGFGAMFRSWGMSPDSRQTSEVGVALVLSATIASLFVVGRLAAIVGFLLAAFWGFIAVAVGTYADSVRLAVVVGLIVVLAAVIGRTLRSGERRTVLLG